MSAFRRSAPQARSWPAGSSSALPPAYVWESRISRDSKNIDHAPLVTLLRLCQERGLQPFNALERHHRRNQRHNRSKREILPRPIDRPARLGHSRRFRSARRPQWLQKSAVERFTPEPTDRTSACRTHMFRKWVWYFSARRSFSRNTRVKSALKHTQCNQEQDAHRRRYQKAHEGPP